MAGLRAHRRLAAAACAVVVATATVLTASASPAQAQSFAVVHPTSWAYTDTAAPARSFTGASLPARVGTWKDDAGERHTSRSYFTWDLSAFVGATIDSASAVLAESSVNDCSAPRRIELWQTDTPGHAITWNHPAAEERLLFAGVIAGSACPTSRMSIDITGAVRRAVAGNGILSIEVRVPGALEHNIHFGRSLDNSAGVQLAYNHAPNIPTELSVGGVACGPDPVFVNSLQPLLRATLTDADASGDNSGDPLTGIFDIWPVDNPAQVTEIDGGFAGYSPAHAAAAPPAGVLVDDGVYLMRVKANDREADSPWSPTCQFTVDVTRPTAAPTVTSTDYPPGRVGGGSGGPGITGSFTFSGGGDTQILGFYYGRSQLDTFVAADQPGGTATVQITPQAPGPYQLVVAGVDRAQNLGPTTTYNFTVKNNAPTVTDANQGSPVGQPRTITFTSNLAGSVAFVYTFNDGPATTVPAAADGTATVTITPTQPSPNTLTVHSVRSDGLASWNAVYGFSAPTP